MTLPHSSWLYTMKLAEASLTQTDRSIVVLPVQAPVRNQHFFFSGQRTQDGITPWGFIFSLARGQNLISVKGPQPRTEEGHGAVGLHNDSISIYIYIYTVASICEKVNVPKTLREPLKTWWHRRQRNETLLDAGQLQNEGPFLSISPLLQSPEISCDPLYSHAVTLYFSRFFLSLPILALQVQGTQMHL